MKIIGLLFGLYLGSIMSAQAQDLSKDATSIITDSRTEVLCKSMTQSIEKESRTILILNRKGLNAAHFVCECDMFRSLQKFSGEILNASGQSVRKIKKSELQKSEYSSSLSTDDYAYYYECNFPSFPFTVKYEWEIKCNNGLIGYQSFLALSVITMMLPPFLINLAPRAAALLTMLPMLLQDNAAQGLSRIWDGLRYRDYAERQKLDGGKYEILCLLARQETGLEGLCRRLDELQALVSAPSLPCGGGLILSTVHSSKGLEYDTVYLLDVLDGILPAVTEPKDAGQQDQYQEERRLFYVAVTRARNRLYLFACRNRESAFADELRRELPREYIGPEDVFASLNTEPCGKHYRHAEKGGGVIRACCRGQCMVAYASGETEFLTLGQMVDRRAVAWRAPDRPAPAALPREQAALPPSGVRSGQRAVHRVFGPGTVLSFRDPIVEIRFPAKGDKKFVLSDSVQRGLLRLEE